MQLDGARAIVTGAGSGIGSELARQLAARGARVLLAGRREAPLRAVRDALPQPSRHGIVAADLTDAEGRAAVVRAARNAERLDLLVNNAGQLSAGRFEALEDADVGRLLAVNLAAPALLTRDLLGLLRRSDRARVLNVGSMFGEIGHPYFALYSASKFGLRGLSEALRRELGPEGIAVSYAAPRATRTALAGSFQPLVGPFGMRLDSPESAARRIVAGLLRDARDIPAPAPERLFLWVQRLLPGLVDAALAAKAARPAARAAATAIDGR